MAETSVERSRSVTLGGQQNPPRLLSKTDRSLSSVLLAPREGNALPDVTRIGAAGVLPWLRGGITASAASPNHPRQLAPGQPQQ